MQNWRPWDAVSKADWGLAVEREAVIRPLAEEAKLSAFPKRCLRRIAPCLRGTLTDRHEGYRYVIHIGLTQTNSPSFCSPRT